MTLNKRLALFILCFVFFLPVVWGGASPAGWRFPPALADAPTDRFPSAIDPPVSGSIGISTPAELLAVQNNMSASYHLTADIDLSGMNWTPIGGRYDPFRGVFDGQGYAILNIRMDIQNTYYAGLFGLVSGSVKNLALQGGQINLTLSNYNDYTYLGAIAGWVSGTVENCYSNVPITVQSTSHKGLGVGGIVGWATTEVAHCNHAGDISINQQDTANYSNLFSAIHIGGIGGRLAGSLGCYNTGNISIYTEGASGYRGTSYVGGIGGENRHAIRCLNLGAIEIESRHDTIESTVYVGGISGRATHEHREAANFGSISSISTSVAGIGGILGTSSGQIYCILESCYNAGTVEGTLVGPMAGISNIAVGGISGSQMTDNSILRCLNRGNVYSSSPDNGTIYSGGICGHAGLTTLQNCVMLAQEVSTSGAKAKAGYFFSSGYTSESTTSMAWDIIAGNAKDNGGVILPNSTFYAPDVYQNAGWDFTTVWTMPAAEGFPILRWIDPSLFPAAPPPSGGGQRTGHRNIRVGATYPLSRAMKAYSSDNPQVASVSVSGLVQGVSEGTTTIRYQTASGEAGALSFTVSQPLLRVGVVSDIHMDASAAREAQLKSVQAEMKYTGVDFGVGLGDNTETGAGAEYAVLQRYIKTGSLPLDMVPMGWVTGNHDFGPASAYKPDVQAEIGQFNGLTNAQYQPNLPGRLVYSRIEANTAFVFINSDNQYMSGSDASAGRFKGYPAQAYAELEQIAASAAVQACQQVVVFAHYPIEAPSFDPAQGLRHFPPLPDGVNQADRMLGVLSALPNALYIHGHTHPGSDSQYNSTPVVTEVGSVKMMHASALSNYNQYLVLDVYENRLELFLVDLRGENANAFAPRTLFGHSDIIGYSFDNTTPENFGYGNGQYASRDAYLNLYGNENLARAEVETNRWIGKGNCFGMSATALQFESGGLRAAAFDPSAAAAYDLKTPAAYKAQGDTRLLTEIETYHLAQLTLEINAQRVANQGQHDALANAVDTFQRTGTAPVVVEVIGNSFSHALAPFAVDMVSDPDRYIISVYDSKYPGTVQTLFVSKGQNQGGAGTSYDGLAVTSLTFSYADDIRNIIGKASARVHHQTTAGGAVVVEAGGYAHVFQPEDVLVTSTIPVYRALTSGDATETMDMQHFIHQPVAGPLKLTAQTDSQAYYASIADANGGASLTNTAAVGTSITLETEPGKHIHAQSNQTFGNEMHLTMLYPGPSGGLTDLFISATTNDLQLIRLSQNSFQLMGQDLTHVSIGTGKGGIVTLHTLPGCTIVVVAYDENGNIMQVSVFEDSDRDGIADSDVPIITGMHGGDMMRLLTLTDPATGISVTGLMHPQTQLVVKKNTPLHPKTCKACGLIRKLQNADKVLLLYDIALQPAVQVGQAYAVSIPVHPSYEGKALSVLHCLHGDAQWMEGTVSNAKINFQTSGFSPFAVLKGRYADILREDTPQTGDNGYILPVAACLSILSLLCMIIACRKMRGLG